MLYRWFFGLECVLFVEEVIIGLKYRVFRVML